MIQIIIIACIKLVTAVSGPCYLGGMKDSICNQNCPPCWALYGTIPACFEYNMDGKCLFDWVDKGSSATPSVTLTKPETTTTIKSKPTKITSQYPSTSTVIYTVKRPLPPQGFYLEESSAIYSTSFNSMLFLVCLVLIN